MPKSQKNPRDQKVDTLCNHCGQAFSAFLHQMEEQNAKVACPSCGKEQEHTPPPKANRPKSDRPARKR